MQLTSMDSLQLRQLVIRPVLKATDLWNPSAEELLLGTCAQESHMGTYIKQLGAGPAKGIYQMEPATHKSLWANFLKYRSGLALKIRGFIPPYAQTFHLDVGHYASDSLLMWDHAYATLMTRVHYLSKPGRLPEADDIQGLAYYWKQHYNTVMGAGTEAEFVENYERFVKPDPYITRG